MGSGAVILLPSGLSLVQAAITAQINRSVSVTQRSPFSM